MYLGILVLGFQDTFPCCSLREALGERKLSGKDLATPMCSDCCVVTLDTSLCWRSEASAVWVSQGSRIQPPCGYTTNAEKWGSNPSILHVNEASTQRTVPCNLYLCN